MLGNTVYIGNLRDKISRRAVEVSKSKLFSTKTIVRKRMIPNREWE